jgi:hypothetical protein
MHVYICPYCKPNPEAVLKKTGEKHKKNHKKIIKCNKCQETFVASVGFLREQKRKIKDG